MAAISEREGSDDAVDDTVAFEVELIHAGGNLAGIANGRLRPGPRLLWRAFVKDRDAEARNDAHGAIYFPLDCRIAAEGNWNDLIKFISAADVAGNICLEPGIVEPEADNWRVVASDVVELRAASVK